MSTKAPLVSVILPVYNGEEYLQETLDSIRAQNYDNIELIVVNDGSTDRSMDILNAENPDVLIEIDNQGAAKARNIALQKVTGEFICFIDQDDLWHVDKTTFQVEAMISNPDHMYGICFQKFFLKEGDPLPGWCKQEWLDKPQEGLLPSALMVRSKLLESFNLIDESMPMTSDVDMFFRLRDKAIPHFNLKQPLVMRRVHKFNTSSDTKMVRTELLRTIRETMIRRRKAQE